jgi:hypothetical protein
MQLLLVIGGLSLCSSQLCANLKSTQDTGVPLVVFSKQDHDERQLGEKEYEKTPRLCFL